MHVQKEISLQILIFLSLVSICGSLSVATVSLNIRKDNYYSPEFPSPINNVVITKGNYSLQRPKQITRLEASDHDSLNETITFNIVGESEQAKKKFRLNKGHVLLVAPAESSSHYVLVVEAVDGGEPPRRSHCAIVVNVQEESVGPAVPSEVYTITVSEQTPPGTNILKIPATDTSGSKLTFSIVSGNEKGEYEIGRKSGVISIQVLNASNTVLAVHVANDEGKSVDTLVDIRLIKPVWHSSPSCICSQDVEVSTVNITTPAIPTRNYSTNVREKTPINTTIYQITETEPMLNSTTFTIVDGNINDDFTIDSTGAVRILHPLNSTLRSEYYLHIQVTDQNGIQDAWGEGDAVRETEAAQECTGDRCNSAAGRAISMTCFWLCLGMMMKTFAI